MWKTIEHFLMNIDFASQACTKSRLKPPKPSKVPTKIVIMKKTTNELKSVTQVHFIDDLQQLQHQIPALQLTNLNLNLLPMGRRSQSSLCHRRMQNNQRHRLRNPLKRLQRQKTSTWCRVRRLDRLITWTRMNNSHQVHHILPTSCNITHIPLITIHWTQWILPLTLTRQKCLGGWTTIATTLHPLYGEFLFIYFCFASGFSQPNLKNWKSQLQILTFILMFTFRNNSIACLRAKAQEHQARLMNSGLLAFQVRSLAGLQHHQLPSPMSSSPKSCDSTMIQHHSPSQSPIRSPESNNNNHNSRNFNSNMTASNDMSEDHIDIEDVKPIHKTNLPNVVTFWCN